MTLYSVCISYCRVCLVIWFVGVCSIVSLDDIVKTCVLGVVHRMHHIACDDCMTPFGIRSNINRYDTLPDKR